MLAASNFGFAELARGTVNVGGISLGGASPLLEHWKLHYRAWVERALVAYNDNGQGCFLGAELAGQAFPHVLAMKGDAAGERVRGRAARWLSRDGSGQMGRAQAHERKVAPLGGGVTLTWQGPSIATMTFALRAIMESERPADFAFATGALKCRAQLGRLLSMQAARANELVRSRVGQLVVRGNCATGASNIKCCDAGAPPREIVLGVGRPAAFGWQRGFQVVPHG